ncbi:MAG: DUF2911 domain-containing protein [Bacteroidetes bacterium]|nr:DUF2911 domain-containing protein [Bacteroidota bacterium]
MKKLILSAFVIIGLCTSSQAQGLKTPAPSPTQTVKQDFGLGSIEVNYSRPSMKGRVIFGDLVPLNKVWRTGANSATTITFSDTTMIAGKKVSPGKYGLLTIPSATDWTIIVSSNTTVTSPEDYKMEEDVVRVKSAVTTLKDKVETFTINVGNIANSTCDIQLAWENTQVSMPISVELDGRIMKDIERYVIKDNRPYGAAANYYAENGKDMKQAIAWYDKAIESNPKAYWNVHAKAKCYAKMGMVKEAIETANKSIAIAKEAKDDNYVSLNEKLIKSLK